jgi:hypothetical protein
LEPWVSLVRLFECFSSARQANNASVAQCETWLVTRLYAELPGAQGLSWPGATQQAGIVGLLAESGKLIKLRIGWLGCPRGDYHANRACPCATDRAGHHFLYACVDVWHVLGTGDVWHRAVERDQNEAAEIRPSPRRELDGHVCKFRTELGQGAHQRGGAASQEINEDPPTIDLRQGN